MRRVLRTGWLTDPGRRRKTNEDAVFADPTKGIFVVADGLGGLPGGDVASRIAIKQIAEVLSGKKTKDTPEKCVRAAIALAGDAVGERAANDASLRGMRTTVVLIFVTLDGPLFVAHVGDSRAYLLRDERLEVLTRDHSVVQELLDSGRISAEAARYHPQRNVITRSLGQSGNADPDLRAIDRRLGDRFLLCSDGLTTMLADPEIEAVLTRYGEPMRCCRELVNRANDRGGLDNITVVVIDEPGEPLK